MPARTSQPAPLGTRTSQPAPPGISVDAPRITIAVAAHKPYRMPTDPVYLPLHVGRALHPELADQMAGFTGDDTGDSISSRNDRYSELTGLWWIAKNVDAEYKGLVHYRRHFRTADFARAHAGDRMERIATTADFQRLITGGADVIVARARDYRIETVQSHWDHTMPPAQLAFAREVVGDLSPDVTDALDAVLASRRVHLFNMMVMRTDILDAYCDWLFPLLGELERRLDASGETASYDAFSMRYPGRISERLLDAWLASRNIVPTEMPTTSPEPVDWPRKAGGFLAAKFLGRRYERSF